MKFALWACVKHLKIPAADHDTAVICSEEQYVSNLHEELIADVLCGDSNMFLKRKQFDNFKYVFQQTNWIDGDRLEAIMV